eukprot:TRINITY_DN43700_c0_g1_i1.p1 TRINITY_DN43700_c0_g1~~TRINITY_DN43700_c0_g1_i1.p1  ORF type:complete len:132 (-),score=15.58 TRINITY_DN43700_c0_g1_i1:97-492(-)
MEYNLNNFDIKFNNNGYQYKSFLPEGNSIQDSKEDSFENLYDEFSHIQHATTLINANSIFRDDCLKTNHVTDKSICSKNYNTVRRAGKESVHYNVSLCFASQALFHFHLHGFSIFSPQLLTDRNLKFVPFE